MEGMVFSVFSPDTVIEPGLGPVTSTDQPASPAVPAAKRLEEEQKKALLPASFNKLEAGASGASGACGNLMEEP